MRRIWLLILGLSAVMYPVGGVLARGLTPRPPIYGIPAKTLPKGRWIFRGYWIMPHINRIYSPELGRMVDMPTGMSLVSNTLVGKVRYGVGARLTAILNIPYVSKRLETRQVLKQGSGLGDVVAAVLYKLHHDKQKRFLFSMLLFTKWPTGRSGNLAPDRLPLGTGSLDAGLALLPEKELGNFDMRWAGFYIVRGRDDSDVDLGDVYDFSWSIAYNASRRFIAEGTLHYKRSSENRRDGAPVENTDMELAQLILGAQVRITRTFLVQIAAPLTLAEKRPFGGSYEVWLGLYTLY